MTESYPYYNYRTYPQSFQQYTGGQGSTGFPQGQMGQMGQTGQMGYPYTQQATTFPAQTGGSMGGQSGAGTQVPGMLPAEQSYIENILRLNKGKLATIYMTFENNREWNAKIFKGIIEAAGRDHIIISDPQTNTRYLLPMIYLDYITFDEEIEYDYPFGGGAGLTAYPPR
jgi:spore germination protein Q